MRSRTPRQACVATLHTTPPADQAFETLGPHTIRTRSANGGYVALLTATYTIDPSPVKTTSKPSPTHPPTTVASQPQAATGPQAAPNAVAVDQTSALLAAPTPPASASDVLSLSTPAGGPGTASLPAVALGNATSGSAMPWVLSVLGVLVLGGAAVFELWVRRRRLWAMGCGAAVFGLWVRRRRRGTQPAE
jgi:hypothetical protein